MDTGAYVTLSKAAETWTWLLPSNAEVKHTDNDTSTPLYTFMYGNRVEEEIHVWVYKLRKKRCVSIMYCTFLHRGSRNLDTLPRREGVWSGGGMV
jgi:hypothetical protein